MFVVLAEQQVNTMEPVSEDVGSGVKRRRDDVFEFDKPRDDYNGMSWLMGQLDLSPHIRYVNNQNQLIYERLLFDFVDSVTGTKETLHILWSDTRAWVRWISDHNGLMQRLKIDHREARTPFHEDAVEMLMYLRKSDSDYTPGCGMHFRLPSLFFYQTPVFPEIEGVERVKEMRRLRSVESKLTDDLRTTKERLALLESKTSTTNDSPVSPGFVTAPPVSAVAVPANVASPYRPVWDSPSIEAEERKEEKRLSRFEKGLVRDLLASRASKPDGPSISGSVVVPPVSAVAVSSSVASPSHPVWSAPYVRSYSPNRSGARDITFISPGASIIPAVSVVGSGSSSPGQRRLAAIYARNESTLLPTTSVPASPVDITRPSTDTRGTCGVDSDDDDDKETTILEAIDDEKGVTTAAICGEKSVEKAGGGKQDDDEEDLGSEDSDASSEASDPEEAARAKEYWKECCVKIDWPVCRWKELADIWWNKDDPTLGGYPSCRAIVVKLIAAGVV